MSKFCIFNLDKLCDNCGECNMCDLTPNKLCDNCGKCMQIEGYDTKAINIDEILEDNEEIELNVKESTDKKELSIESLSELNKDLKDSDIHIEYIDDVDGLSELLEDENNSSNLINEIFPGFITLNTNK